MIVPSPGKDVTIIATGHLVWPAFQAGLILQEKGIDAEIINIHTIKPLDKEAVIQSALKTKCVVTIEEHLMNDGLGDSIAQLFSLQLPTPLEMVAVDDKFGESGPPDQLMVKYGLDTQHIVDSALKAISRKV